MELWLTNTLGGEKQRFEPLDPLDVRMYVCGPTVYDFAHIGNARPAVVFDILFRLLQHLYGADHVSYARNITDVDDKIIAAHKQTGESIRDLTTRVAETYHQDMGALNCLSPTMEPRATDHIADMVSMIERLAAAGHAYAAEGHVLFDVASMPTYGRLSRRSLDEMIAGARVEVAPYKRGSFDFVLWKPSADDEPGWPSPWGRGRPGWHIECSAMSCRYLGETFDIHGGGQDLIFPHHENEIAQSTCAHEGQTFARYWMHNGFLMTEGEKMSKSLGNFYTVHDLRQEFPGEAIRLALMQTHYRQPLDFTKEGLGRVRHTLDRIYGALRPLAQHPRDPAVPPPDAVVAALADDLNTAEALAAVHSEVADLNRLTSEDEKIPHRDRILAAGELLGLFTIEPEAWFRWSGETDQGLGDEDIAALIEQRRAARKAKNFAEADKIRDDLAAAGIILEDGPGGTTWRRG